MKRLRTIVPKFWKQAVNKFTEATLQEYGIVPWHLKKMLQRLTDAFKPNLSFK
ncbi:MAG: hypothetical protein IT239_01445 [Bacteroidia bacterium]|nr:hypothetical protein [Bacteroidia bacterium]